MTESSYRVEDSPTEISQQSSSQSSPLGSDSGSGSASALRKEAEYLKEKLKLLEAELKLKRLQKELSQVVPAISSNEQNISKIQKTKDFSYQFKKLSILSDQFVLKIDLRREIEKLESKKTPVNVNNNKPVTVAEEEIQMLKQQILFKQKKRKQELKATTYEKLKNAKIAEVAINKTEIELRQQFLVLKQARKNLVEHLNSHRTNTNNG